MLIAVTGATGFLGRYIVNHLLAQGHTVRAWYRGDSDRSGFDAGGSKLKWLRGDLGRPGPTKSLVRDADAVVHAALARYGSGFGGTEGDLAGFVELNVLGSVRLMQAAREAGVKRFVFISTCAVHDVILPDRKLDEAHPAWSKSHYGAHKAAIEEFVYSYGLGEGWEIASLRPTGIYGLKRKPEGSRFIDIVRDVIDHKPITSAAGGKEIHAADVAKAVGVLLNAPGASIAGQAFNCYDMYVAAQDVAQIAKQITGSKSTIELANKGPKNQIDTTKLRALGMQFGGKSLLEKTISELVEVARKL